MKEYTEDAITNKLYSAVRFSVRIFSVLMVYVILMGVVDVAWTI
jgi:hypothetical protein